MRGFRRGISVHSLYAAKKRARQRGLLPPLPRGKAKTPRSQKVRALQFVEATAVVSSRPSPTAWSLRFIGGEVLESNTPLEVEVAIRWVELLRRHS